jgi:hypothetical protein
VEAIERARAEARLREANARKTNSAMLAHEPRTRSPDTNRP